MSGEELERATSVANVPPSERIRANPAALKEPGDTVGRDEWVRDVWRKLKAGTHLQVMGPRRLGKTQAVKAVAGSRPERWEVVYVDIEPITSLSDAVATLLDALRTHQPLWHRGVARIKALLNRGGAVGPVELAPGVQTQPQRALTSALATIDDELEEDDRYVLVIVDEVADAVINIVQQQDDGIAQAKTLLQTLRACRQQFPRVRQILLGSVGLRGVLSRYDMGDVPINDLDAVQLDPLDRSGARQLAVRLLAGTLPDDATWDPAALDELWQTAGGFALMTEITIDRIAQHLPQDRHVTAELVRTIHTQKIMMSGTASQYFRHFVHRVDVAYPDGTDAILRLLDRSARAGRIDLEQARQDLADHDQTAVLEILERLDDDGYLDRLDDRQWRWAHAPLAEVWVQMRGEADDDSAPGGS